MWRPVDLYNILCVAEREKKKLEWDGHQVQAEVLVGTSNHDIPSDI